MKIIIREMRPHLLGFDIPKDQVKKFIKNYKNFVNPIEILVCEDDYKVIKKVLKSPR